MGLDVLVKRLYKKEEKREQEGGWLSLLLVISLLQTSGYKSEIPTLEIIDE